jgi:hypothetical protein
MNNKILMALYILRGILKDPITSKSDALEYIDHLIEVRESKGESIHE